MGRVARYAYLNARVSGMARLLLPRDALAGLVDQPEVQEADVLRMLGLQPPEGEGRALEQQSIGIVLADLIKLARGLSGAARDFFIYWAHRFELGNLKTILRGKMTGQPAEVIRRQLVDMGPFARLPIDDLLRVDEVTELLRRLEDTAYAEIAREARRVLGEHRELFALDAALDRRYYAGLAARAAALQHSEDGDLRALMSGIVDRINLVWLLRYRFGYALPPAEAYYLLIPATYRLGRRALLELSQLGSLEEALAALPPPFDALLRGAETVREVALRLEQDAWDRAARVLHTDTFSLARAFAYLILRERDLRQTHAVLRGKRLKMTPALIADAIGLREAAHA